MKMENYVYSPLAGSVDEILVGPSQGVDAGDVLVKLSQTSDVKTASSEKSSAGEGKDEK
jgi:acetyl-CoA/propionyl-CoA carboxylase biotin carboxyl carrier protein